MKQFSTCILLLVLVSAFGQQAQISEDIMQAIKSDVWIPFMEAYDESDSEKLKSIHTQDIVRVILADNKIETGESYLESFGNFVESVKNNGGQLGIAFAILSCAINEEENLAYQTGYYRFSSKGADDEQLMVRGYGHFSVGLKKVGGNWKIWLDSDKRTDISHDDFNAQEIVYELEK